MKTFYRRFTLLILILTAVWIDLKGQDVHYSQMYATPLYINPAFTGNHECDYRVGPDDPARLIHNADAGLLDRYVQSSKMVHAALLLLMLEAVNHGPRFTISLKRSTQNLQLSTSCRPITPSIGLASGHSARRAQQTGSVSTRPTHHVISSGRAPSRHAIVRADHWFARE